MNDTYWTFCTGSGHKVLEGLCHLSVFQPPFDVDARDLPPRDTERARTSAESFVNVEEVLEDLGPRSVLTRCLRRFGLAWASSTPLRGEEC